MRWKESVEYMISKGVDTFVEMGPGAVLSGLIKKIDKNVKVFNIDKVSDVEKLVLVTMQRQLKQNGGYQEWDWSAEK